MWKRLAIVLFVFVLLLSATGASCADTQDSTPVSSAATGSVSAAAAGSVATSGAAAAESVATSGAAAVAVATPAAGDRAVAAATPAAGDKTIVSATAEVNSISVVGGKPTLLSARLKGNKLLVTLWNTGDSPAAPIPKMPLQIQLDNNSSTRNTDTVGNVTIPVNLSGTQSVQYVIHFAGSDLYAGTDVTLSLEMNDGKLELTTSAPSPLTVTDLTASASEILSSGKVVLTLTANGAPLANQTLFEGDIALGETGNDGTLSLVSLGCWYHYFYFRGTDEYAPSVVTVNVTSPDKKTLAECSIQYLPSKNSEAPGSIFLACFQLTDVATSSGLFGKMVVCGALNFCTDNDGCFWVPVGGTAGIVSNPAEVSFPGDSDYAPAKWSGSILPTLDQ